MSCNIKNVCLSVVAGKISRSSEFTRFYSFDQTNGGMFVQVRVLFRKAHRNRRYCDLLIRLFGRSSISNDDNFCFPLYVIIISILIYRFD